MLGGEAGSTSCHLARSRTSNFPFGAYTAHIQFPCQTYLTYICCMPIQLWVRRGPKVQPNVNVTIPVSECCSAWMLLWFLGWGESDSLEKRTIYAVTRWLARQVGQKETCSEAWKNGIFSDQSPGSCADLRILGGQKVSRFSRKKPDPRDLFQAPRCSLGSVAFPEENTADFWGEDPGIQGRWGASFHWHCTVAAANHAFLDLSFGVAPVCCHRV